ncbi:MAG: CoA transferase [Desulfobacteraceae bacterium]|nr:CoA transferase [Desulfobacteraceae bacterium]
MPGPLEGIQILSFCTALSGPFCTMILGDMGAEVIKIETIGEGDRTRNSSHKINGVGTYFLSVNRGKKSITLNLKEESAKAIVFDLVKQVDVLTENFRPGVMKRLGFDYETLSKINPRLVYASISGFGQTGPFSHKPAYDMIAQGMGGVVSITGLEEPGTPHVRVGYSIGDMAAGMFAAIGIQAALLGREKTGEGQWVDVSMLDSQVALCENAIVRYFATGEIPKPQGSRHPLSTPFQVYDTKDKPLIVVANSEKLWGNFCRAAEKEEWIADERYKTRDLRLANYPKFNQEMSALMRTRTYEDWVNRFETHEVMYAPVNNIEEVTQHPQVLARNMISEVEHPVAGKHKIVNSPIKFSKTPARVEKAAPELGANTHEILSRKLGMSDTDIEKLKKANII